MPTNNHLEHALHNEKACLYLQQSDEFRDWIITTAFYSTLHFVKYKVFPIEIGKSSFSNFNAYFNYERNRTNFGRSPHDILRKLLNKKFRNIATAYSDLYDTCHNARYLNYQVDNKEAEQALKYFEEIKKFCNTDKPSK